ncbi:immunoglobulin-like domain-containing receptor 2 isoform X2 [Amia ocellicauda]|uniref:immunoglobulin-like domain-containing receptor 2 isoform X2 n=1 Tax=Amia ocellicauda TaxID=2972642 RepID=UPI0034645BDE
MWTMDVFWLLWIPFLSLTVGRCAAVHVRMREDKKFAMLFQPVVLECQYSTQSTQPPVVQWWYKSYCHDRTKEAFSFSDSLGVPSSETSPSSHLDCADNSRTVRVVASRQGTAITLAEFYKGRDITIINKADLRIGELRWGDSGVYYCKVVISDDLEGINEEKVELLVLGKTGVLDDFLPDFDVEVMPEWLFVGVVILGGFTFILFVGICWCQCCPHSCCCYLRCPCCPDTCCCPRHLYEAGKAGKTSATPHIAAIYPPYYVPNVPMVPIGPPALLDPKIGAPAVENNVTGVRSGYRIQASKEQDSMKVLYYVEKELAQFDPAKRSYEKSSSMSELSSLHEGDTDFRQSYRKVQRKALPAIEDRDEESEFRATSSVQGRRSARYPLRTHRSDEQSQNSRWKPRSEHLQRKAFRSDGRTGSLDELEEFALSYDQRPRRGDYRDGEREYTLDIQSNEHCPPLREQHRYHDDEHTEAWLDRHQYRKAFPEDHYRKGERGGYEPERGRQHSPPSPKRRNPSERCPTHHLGSSKGYDNTFLTSVLERKARLRVPDESFNSETPSKSSSKKSGDCYYSRSPSCRPEEEDCLPPYSEIEGERNRSLAHSARPFSYTRDPQSSAHTLQDRREDREKLRKTNTLLSRDSLVV